MTRRYTTQSLAVLKPRSEYLLIALASIAWGSAGVFFRRVDLPGQEQVVLFWRSLFSVLFFSTVIAGRREFSLFKPGSRPCLLLSCGLVAALLGLSYFKALSRLSIGEATFLMYLAPVFIAFGAPVFLKEKFERTTVLCLALGLSGTALMALSRSGGRPGSHSFIGVLFGLFSALLYAALVLITKELRDRLSPLTIGFWLAAVVLVVSSPFAVPQHYSIGAVNWFALFVMGTFHVGLVWLIYLYALKKAKAQHAGVLAYIEPLSATVFGIICLNEIPAWYDLVGSLLILTAGFITVMSSSRR